MREARGHILQRIFIPPLLKKYFPQWKKRDTVQLCVTILKMLEYLHDRNVILGDINPNNILVVSPTEVYFVDTDSYQISGYPCPVGTVNFTAPEIQRKRYDEFIRTIGNENFAVATLLFMIMLPGKPPYSLQGGENQIENIINMDFAYASGEKSNKKAPEGPWRYCWSHLPRYLKDDFYATFRKGGERSNENSRFNAGEWIQKFEEYLKLLDSGKLASNDPNSIEIFPPALKKNINVTYTSCVLCGLEVDKERTKQGYCPKCLYKDGEVYECAQCNRDIFYSNYQKLICRSRKYDICKECNDKNNEVWDSIYCKVCGSYFDITYGQKNFYDKKGLSYPKRCSSCRKNSQSSYTSPVLSYPPPISTYTLPASTYTPPASTYTPPKPTSNNKGWCFITTAVCEYFNKPDNCYELTVLREYRDNWLAKQEPGVMLIKEYYDIAPKIVGILQNHDERDVIYGEIWEKYINPCIKLIEMIEYHSCRELYSEMVDTLKFKLL